jgi:hypothetical protein
MPIGAGGSSALIVDFVESHYGGNGHLTLILARSTNAGPYQSGFNAILYASHRFKVLCEEQICDLDLRANLFPAQAGI